MLKNLIGSGTLDISIRDWILWVCLLERGGRKCERYVHGRNCCQVRVLGLPIYINLYFHYSPMAFYTICPFIGPVLGPVISG